MCKTLATPRSGSSKVPHGSGALSEPRRRMESRRWLVAEMVGELGTESDDGAEECGMVGSKSG